MGGVSFLPEFPLGGFVVEITRKDTPPGSFPPIHNFQLYLAQHFQVELLVEVGNGITITREMGVSEVLFVTEHLRLFGEPIELGLVYRAVSPHCPARLWGWGLVGRVAERDEKA
jgi:hypothetical protein